MSRRLLPLVSFVCCVSSFLLLTHAASAADVSFVRVWPAWRDAESFERIGEHFGKPENTGRELVLRTQPDHRGGYYFLVRVKAPGSAAASTLDAHFKLEVVRPDKPEPFTYTFPVSLRTAETVFQLGLTGADWPGGSQANPVAWKLALVGADGHTLAQHESFLWEKPAK